MDFSRGWYRWVFNRVDLLPLLFKWSQERILKIALIIYDKKVYAFVHFWKEKCQAIHYTINLFVKIVHETNSISMLWNGLPQSIHISLKVVLVMSIGILERWVGGEGLQPSPSLPSIWAENALFWDKIYSGKQAMNFLARVLQPPQLEVVPYAYMYSHIWWHFLRGLVQQGGSICHSLQK